MKRLKVRKNIKKSKAVMLVLVLVFFFTGLIFRWYSKGASPKITTVAKARVNEFMESFLSNNIGYDILNKEDLENVLVMNMNSEGEILYVDYNLDQAYKVLDIVTEKLYDLINDLEEGNYEGKLSHGIISKNDHLVLKLPLLINSKNILISSLGPDIYVPINFIGSILTNLKTKITEYGMNNALIEIYVTIKLTINLTTPVEEEGQVILYDTIIGSKVINGRVPAIYGGAITTKSNALSIPIE